MAWGVSSWLADLCGMFCPVCQELHAWDVIYFNRFLPQQLSVRWYKRIRLIFTKLPKSTAHHGLYESPVCIQDPPDHCGLVFPSRARWECPAVGE